MDGCWTDINEVYRLSDHKEAKLSFFPQLQRTRKWLPYVKLSEYKNVKSDVAFLSRMFPPFCLFKSSEVGKFSLFLLRFIIYTHIHTVHTDTKLP